MFIDSNIWCYYFDSSAKEHSKVVEFLEKIMIRKEQISVNTVIVMEISHYLIKNLGPITGKEKIEIFLSLPIKITDFDYQLLDSSINILAENSYTGIGGRDATIISAMKKEKSNKILTHDKSFKKIKKIKVIDPLD